MAVAGAIWALYYVPKMQVPVCPPGQDGLPPKICFDIENEARKTLAYILGGILAIIGIYMAHRRIRALERQVQIGQEQLQVAQEGQITERFTRAIEQLGSDKMAIRLGGIYALERIANDSDRDYWPIVETLTAYVRERAPWQEHIRLIRNRRQKPSGRPGMGQALPKPATDIQAILTVLGRRKYCYGRGEKQDLDFRSHRPARGRRSGVHIFRVLFSKSSHLERAVLAGARLEGIYLPEAYLNEAILIKANLERAILRRAHLEGAFLIKAHMEGAILEGCPSEVG